MRPIRAHALGHFCMNFKKVIFFEYLIMFCNFLALDLRNLGKRAHCNNPNSIIQIKTKNRGTKSRTDIAKV